MKNTDITNLLNKKFDVIYCLHYLPYKERLPKCIEELKRVGIYYHKNFKFMYDIDSSAYNILYNNLPGNQFIGNVEKFGAFKIGFKHYEICKECYYLGYNNILILEDDEVFLKNIEEIYNIFNNTPNYDVCLYDWVPYTPGINPSTDNMFFNFDKLWMASCYAFNNKFINYIIKVIEESNYTLGIDTAFHTNDPNYIKIASSKHIGIQHNFISDRSHLGPQNNIYYNSINININEYNI